MEPYVSFPDDAILGGVASPEGFWSQPFLGVPSQPLPIPPLKRLLQRKQPPLGGLRRSPVPPRPQVGSQPGG